MKLLFWFLSPVLVGFLIFSCVKNEIEFPSSMTKEVPDQVIIEDPFLKYDIDVEPKLEFRDVSDDILSLQERIDSLKAELVVLEDSLKVLQLSNSPFYSWSTGVNKSYDGDVKKIAIGIGENPDDYLLINPSMTSRQFADIVQKYVGEELAKKGHEGAIVWAYSTKYQVEGPNVDANIYIHVQGLPDGLVLPEFKIAWDFDEDDHFDVTARALNRKNKMYALYFCDGFYDEFLELVKTANYIDGFIVSNWTSLTEIQTIELSEELLKKDAGWIVMFVNTNIPEVYSTIFTDAGWSWVRI